MAITHFFDLDGAPVERSDLDLIMLTRSGDEGAFGELWARHYHAGIRAARSITQNHDPEDMVQEAFTRIFKAIRGDHGPREVFRAYLYMVLRSVSMSWSNSEYSSEAIEELQESQQPAYSFEGQLLDGAITSQAFATLKPEWRSVLWYLEVEGMTPREVAPILGMSANATSALAYRAKEGLRSSWLQAHLNSDRAEPECKWSVERIGSYNRGSLAARDKNKLESHLTTCLKCSILVEEIDQLGRNLGILLLPLFLGPAAIPFMDVGALGTLAGSPKGPKFSLRNIAGTPKFRFGLIATAVGIGGILVAGIVITNSSGPTTVAELLATAPTVEPSITAPPVTPEPQAQPSPTPTRQQPALPTPSSPQPNGLNSAARQNSTILESPDQALQGGIEPGPVNPEPIAPPRSTPVQTPTPQPTPQETTQPTGPTGPQSTATPPAVTPPTEPVSLGKPIIDLVEEQGLFLPVVSGTGVAGATLYIEARGQGVGSTLVDANGRWSLTPEVTPEADGTARFTAFQKLEALTSEPSSPTNPITLAVPELLNVESYESGTQVLFQGPAGSVVEAILDGKSTGNFHTMNGQPVTRTVPSLTPGTHTLTFRFVQPDENIHGAPNTVLITEK